MQAVNLILQVCNSGLQLENTSIDGSHFSVVLIRHEFDDLVNNFVNTSQRSRDSKRHTSLSCTKTLLSLSRYLNNTLVSVSLNDTPGRTLEPNAFRKVVTVYSLSARHSPPKDASTVSAARSTNRSKTYSPSTLFHISASLYASSDRTMSSCSIAHQSGFPTKNEAIR